MTGVWQVDGAVDEAAGGWSGPTAAWEYRLRWSRGGPLREVRVEAWPDGSGGRRHLWFERRVLDVLVRPLPGDGWARADLRAHVAVWAGIAPRAATAGEQGFSFPCHVRVHRAYALAATRWVPGPRPLRLELLRRLDVPGRWRVRGTELDGLDPERRDPALAVPLWCEWPGESLLPAEIEASDEAEAWRRAEPGLRAAGVG